MSGKFGLPPGRPGRIHAVRPQEQSSTVTQSQLVVEVGHTSCAGRDLDNPTGQAGSSEVGVGFRE